MAKNKDKGNGNEDKLIRDAFLINAALIVLLLVSLMVIEWLLML